MTQDRWQRIRDIFEGAIDAPATGRMHYLRQACSDDAELQREVLLMLVNAEAPSPLDEPITLQTNTRDGFVPEMRLGDRFRLLGILGAGGMGEVWEAYDEEIGAAVAIKTLRPEIAHSSEFVDSFKLEVQRTRSITHRNVCRVYDLFVHKGERGPVPFLTMELLAGETLSDRLARQGPLPLDEAKEILEQCAGALDAAHGAGIVHRDFKPGNIMLLATDNGLRAVVMDFGIASAQAISQSTPMAAIGTPAYLAPEIEAGAPATSAADVYSFAIVACEILTGVRPGDGGIDLLTGHWRRPILSALEADPQRRPASAGALLAKVSEVGRRAVLLTAFAASAAVAAGAWQLWLTRTTPVLAILPFGAGTGPEDRGLADGFVHELLRTLQLVPGLDLIPSISSEGRVPPFTNYASVSTELSARYLVLGSLRSKGDRVVVQVQIFDGPRNFQLWSERYERPKDQLAQVRRQIAAAVPEQLGLTPVSEPKRDPVSEAYRALLLGRHHLQRRTNPELARAREYFEKSITLDSELAPAHSGLAETLLVLSERSLVLPAEGLARAKQAAEKCVELEPRLADGWAALGLLSAVLDHSYSQSGLHFDHALALDSDNLIGQQWYSFTLAQQGYFERARELARRVVRLNPVSVPGLRNLVVVEFLASSHDAVIAAAEKLREVDSSGAWPAAVIGHAHAHLGNRGKAHQELARAVAEGASYATVLRISAEAYAVMGRKDASRALLQRLLQMRTATHHVPPSYIAFAFAALGEKEEAFRWLETAWNERDSFLAFTAVYPAMQPLRVDPRFHSFVNRLGLTGTIRRG